MALSLNHAITCCYELSAGHKITDIAAGQKSEIVPYLNASATREIAHSLSDFLRSLLQIPFLAERTDLVALLDEFASRFFDELDYVKECANGVAIRDQMQHIKQVNISSTSLTTVFLLLLLHDRTGIFHTFGS